MRIKMLKKVMVTGHRDPLRPNVVVEATDDAQKAEFKVLVNMGYAVETKEAPTNKSKGDAPENKDKTNSDNTNPVTPNSGEAPVDPDTFDPASILAGKVEDVVAALDSLSVDDLIVLRAAEVAGKNRAGVLEAVDEFDLEG